ncbi:maleylpyruvate isomerase family mycothiol-dependent enzyme [Nocardioides sp. URHA0032]|uniref:maleylpyruvate isomerase family mycothiol-dependent enzyme n=1 Tax=Nocardioides sp. URHA0032 TaxID=1380388 RepID=UPI00048E66AB|nr:maleylpyruvate isomerase N-terminal domain-containing protein [Nocardioides sp. URHA0032]
MQPRASFDAAADAFLDLVGAVPRERYDGPGLGDWDLRSLIGHTGRSLVTVATYLRTRADTVAVASPAAYYVAVDRFATAETTAAIDQRGVDAGQALGDDPVAALHQHRADADAALAALDGDPVVETIAGGMRVSDYLPTRTFELTVHCLDIARATGLAFTPPTVALAEALELASASALELGLGTDVLLALTGRQPLPPGCSVVP